MSDYTSCSRCDFVPGELIDGKYSVKAMLGEGSFGRVYKVCHGNTVYALKLFKFWENLNSDIPELVKRFDREYEVGRINSKYLVHAIEKGVVNGNPYILMEFCPKGDLLTYIGSSTNVNFSEIASNILHGLKDLHQTGKIHRDLKPENVLLRDDGTAVLTDFGIAGDSNNRMTRRGVVMGTCPYMAPEQINPPRFSKPSVSPTIDIFSFGVMMYELLLGGFPFGPCNTRDDLAVYVVNAKNGRWDRDTLRKKAPEWYSLMDGCLKSNSKDRLQTVDAVLSLVPKNTISSKPLAPQSQQHKKGILLRVIQGENLNLTYQIANIMDGKPRILTMGRKDVDVLNHIAITEENTNYISRCHCTLEYDMDKQRWLIRDGQYRIDCDIAKRCYKEPYPCRMCTAMCPSSRPTGQWKRSLNGTYVNSAEINENGSYFAVGDIITVGNVKLRVEGF